MTTLYTTARGATYDPLPVELVTWQGERLGRIGGFDAMSFTRTAKPGTADTATLEVYLDELTTLLLPCDGSVLIAARYNGETLLYAPVTAEVKSDGNDPSVAHMTVQATGAWSFLEGSVTTPNLDGEINTTSNETFEYTDTLEGVVKRLIEVGRKRNSHPLVITPSLGRGPQVTVTGKWETVAEHVADVLKGSGYMLAFTGWAPGDPQPIDGTTLTAPCYVVDIVPHTRKTGLVWSTLGGDLASWSVTHKRATATRAIAHNGENDPAERDVFTVQGVEPVSPWAWREAYVNHKPSDDENNDPLRWHAEVEAAAVAYLTEHGPAFEVTAEVEASAGWEYGTDGANPRQFTIGNIATIDLPVIGEINQVITDVELKITPEALTVTPTVGTPDTLDLTTFGAFASLNKRLTRLERKG